MSVQDVGTKKVHTRLTKPSTLGIYLIGYPFNIYIRINLFLKEIFKE